MEFKTKPFNHQLEAFNEFKNSPYCALLMDMGTGKSKIAIDLSAYKFLAGLHTHVIVISKTEVHPQWVDKEYRGDEPLGEFEKHCPVPWDGMAYSATNKVSYVRKLDKFLLFPAEEGALKVFTVNFESFARPKGEELCKRFCSTSKQPPIIIIDEASKIKNPDTKTVTNLCKLRAAKLWPDSFRVVLTGTPAAKAPIDLWSIYDWLCRSFMGCSYVAFKREHAVMIEKKRKIKKRLITVKDIIDEKAFTKIQQMIANNTHDGELNPYAKSAILEKWGISESNLWFIKGCKEFTRFKNIPQLQKKIAPVTYAINKNECLDLPKKVKRKHVVELNKHQSRLIKDLRKYSLAMYGDKELTVEMQQLLSLRILQICGGFFAHHTDIEAEYATIPIEGKNPKLTYLQEAVPEIGEQQYLIWAVFQPENRLIYDTLRKDFNVALLDGTVAKIDRPEIISKFKKGETQGLICHPEVGGYGQNFQMAGVQFWYSRNYRTEARLQAEDRSHRPGIVESPEYVDILANTPEEFRVLQILEEGANLNTQFVSVKLNELFK